MKEKWSYVRLLLVTTVIGLVSCSEPKPEIVVGPSDVIVRQGENATLKCVVELLPVDDLSPVTWTKGQFALGYDRELNLWDRYSMVGDISIGEYNLLIKNVSAVEDDTEYECQVTKFMLRSRRAKLTVLVPPRGPFIEGLRGDNVINVVADRENEIVCRSEGGKPAATLSWYKDGIQLTTEIITEITGPNKMLYDTSATLRIKPSKNDDSTYVCVMSSEAMKDGEIKSQMMKLNVQSPPEVVISLPSQVGVGEAVTAQCSSKDQSPITSYRWYIDSELQSDQVLSSLDLVINDRTWDKRLISCAALNDAGTSEISESRLNVLYAPVFIRGTDDVTAEIGDNVTLRCEWDSNPRPEIRWLRDGDDNIIGKNTELVLNKVEQNESGGYVCMAIASNAGENRKTLSLKVRGPPMFSSSETQYSLLGDTATITCEVKSYPELKEVTWSWQRGATVFSLFGNESQSADRQLVHGDVISGTAKYQSRFNEGDRRAVLLVGNVEKNDLGYYSCAASNQYGIETQIIKLDEDTGSTSELVLMGAVIGGAIGGLIFLCVFICVIVYCAKSRRERKSTNFDKQQQNSHKYSAEEMTPMTTHVSGHVTTDYNQRASLSSQDVAPTSSVSGSDVTPTPHSGGDDGYHTEEANSWNRSEHVGKISNASASPSKSLSTTGYQGYNPIPSPLHEDEQPMYDHQYTPSYVEIPRPMSANRYGYDTGPYDPTTLTHSTAAMRCASAMAERLSPPPVRYVQRKYSDLGPRMNNFSIAPQPMDYYPNVRPFSPLHTMSETNPTFVTHTTQIPESGDYYQVPLENGSSESSLDKIERGSALPSRGLLDPYENASRVSNMSSRMSQSSRSSDFLRPLTARMATHV